MDPSSHLKPIPGGGGSGGSDGPVTEADLHAFADGQLTEARRAQIEAFLRDHPAERQRVDDWRAQNEALRQWLDPVVSEPLPLRLPLSSAASHWHRGPWRALAAGVLIAVASAGSAWWLRGEVDDGAGPLASLGAGPSSATAAPGAAGADTLRGFAHRAAVAHAVYSPDARRPVEVSAADEQALVTWLTKRMGTAVKPPDLRGVGYALIGGRLLPGDKGPVAQFMFDGAKGQRLTLYVTREDAGRETAFRFGQDGPVNVFYWVDKDFGYALSAGADRAELLRVAQAVYGQLEKR